MSYQSLEESQQDAQPTLLFKFLQSSSAWYYYAGNSAFLFGGHWYQPEAILCDSLKSTSNVPKDSLEIKLPVGNTLADLLLAYAPEAVTTVTIYRLHHDDSENRTAWKGRVLSYTAALGTLTIVCESVFASMRRLGLRQTYQRLCRHVLGGPGCNVNLASYSSEQTVLALSGAQVTFADLLPVDYTRGTLVAPDGTICTISSVGSNFVRLLRPSKALVDSLAANPSGFTVTLRQGCDRSTGMCAARYNNIGNHGGFPGIPWINPMTNVSSVF